MNIIVIKFPKEVLKFKICFKHQKYILLIKKNKPFLKLTEHVKKNGYKL